MWDGSYSEPRKMNIKSSSGTSSAPPRRMNPSSTKNDICENKPRAITPLASKPPQPKPSNKVEARPLSSLKVSPSKIMIKIDDPILVNKVPDLADRNIILSILSNIDMKDTSSIMNATENVELGTSSIIDDLLEFNFTSFDIDINKNLDKIMEMARDEQPGFFSSLFGMSSSITTKDKIKIVDSATSELKYQIIKLKNRIGDLDRLFLKSREKIADIQYYLTALDISGEWFKDQKENFSDLEKQLTKSNLDILDIRVKRLYELKISLEKDPIAILLSKDNLIGKIALIEATVFGLVHEWKLNIQLKSENKSNNLKEIANSLRESIERTQNVSK